MKNIIGLLENYKESNKENLLKVAIVEDLLSNEYNNEELENYINDVCTHGCVSGMVGSLIYYNDTEKFFKEYASEVFELMQEFKDNVGEYPLIDSKEFDLNMNNLAWFSYESICYELQTKIENESEILEEIENED